jgi:hypothetical protein
MPFSAEQKAKVREILEAEPCLFNARHKRDYVTMAAWINEVVGQQSATAESVAEVMCPEGPDRWDPFIGKWVAVEASADDAPAVDSWEAQRKALGSVLG